MTSVITRTRVYVSAPSTGAKDRIRIYFERTCPSARIDEYAECLDGLTGIGSVSKHDHDLVITLSHRNVSRHEHATVPQRLAARLDNLGLARVATMDELVVARPVH